MIISRVEQSVAPEGPCVEPECMLIMSIGRAGALARNLCTGGKVCRFGLVVPTVGAGTKNQ